MTDLLNFLSDLFYVGFPIGMAFAVVWFLIKFVMRNFPDATPLRYLATYIIKKRAIQLEQLGFTVYVYISWADGRKIPVSRMAKENEIVVNDPLIFEHHVYKDIPFIANESVIFVNQKNHTVKGYFHRINSKDRDVYHAQLVNIVARDSGKGDQ